MLPRLTPVCPIVAAALTCAVGVSAADSGNAVARKSYNLPGGDAAATLKQFAADSGEQIVYLVDNVRGEKTNAIVGTFSAREALDRMLAGTALFASQDVDTGALVVGRARPTPSGNTAREESSNPASQTERKSMNPSTVRARVAAWLAVLAAPLADAQTAPDTAAAAPDSKTITLSAFEVTSDRDVGYTASSALAGGRIEAPLKETPSAITMMTREFLDDIAATSVASAAEWAPNAIPAGDAVQGAGGEHQVNFRGLGASFPSRNYFRWYVSSDSFSTERLEFARGPNAILFGDANPGGVNTTWSKQALFNPRRSVQLRADSWGGYRASLDLNQPVGDTFAVRLNVLHDRLNGWRDDDDAQRDGVHVAATYRLSRDTQLRGEYEEGSYHRYAFLQTFTDQSSNWNRTTVYNGTGTPSTSGTGIARLNSNAAADYLVWDGSVGEVVNWRGFYQSTGTNLTLLPGGRDKANFPTYPGYKFSRQPPDAFVDADYKTWTLYLEHRFTPSLMVQAAYNHQQQQRYGNVRQWNVHRIDVNTVLPNGQPNPNFGEVFTDQNTNLLDRPNRLHDWRLSLAHRTELSWMRHSLSLVGGYRTDQYSPRDFRLGRVNGPNPDASNATNVVMIRQYWNAPRNPATPATLSSNGGEYRWMMIGGSDEWQNLQYNQIASASSFLDGKLSVLLGYRYDIYDRKQQAEVASQPDGTPIFGANGTPGDYNRMDVSLDTISAGAVWFPVPWIGPFVNYSEGFNTVGNGPGKIDGSGLSNSFNEGIDVGLKLEFFGGKLSGSIGYYDTTQVDRPRNGDNTTDINQIWTDLGKIENTLVEGYRDTESYRGTGFELDLTANLTRNWRLMFNYALPETEQAEIGAGLRGYYDQHIAEWRAGANSSLPNAALIAQNITDIERTLQGYTQGRTLNNTVDYTANLYTTYSFREGAFKGFAVGGGANFRGKQVVGNVNGEPFNYLHADAYTLWSGHISYSHRIGKFRARHQLNVTNLLDERDPIFTGYTNNNALGGDVPNGFRNHAPRRFMLTTTFDF